MTTIKKAELELISDAYMYLFFGKGMKGKVCSISKRYSKASIKYLKSYDSKQESKHIIHLNVDSLYDFTMSRLLPTSRFK